ncbi:MAG: homocysteine methyltransferase [Thermotoga sp.]|nr:MAG: homocysteine methyltransferase [Thermotoga sp.]
MSDIKELKAAVLGIRSITSELPLIAHMTFEENSISVTGTSVKIFATVFEDLDVDIIGMNCTLGPDKILKPLKELCESSTKPISVEPNAGKPIYDGNRLYYKMDPESFAVYAEDYIDQGVNIIGGCCGTSPEHIKVLRKMISNRRPMKRKAEFEQAFASRTVYKPIKSFVIMGERINPASKKVFQKRIVDKDYTPILNLAREQEKEGSTIIDINLGIEKLLDESYFRQVIRELDRISSLPLSLDIQMSRYLEVALREYPGRALINSARVIPESLERKIDLLKRYGGVLVLLAMGKEIPKTSQGRVEKILEGIEILENNGISRDRVFADPLVLPLGANNDPNVTLETIKHLSDRGIKTTLGLSNLSFGMPDRSVINGAFLSQAINVGLRSAIMNSKDTFVMNSLKGALYLKGEDLEDRNAIQKYDDPLVEILLKGNTDELKKLIDKKLKEFDPLTISQEILGKAMEKIGDLYSKGVIYLPHLLLASDTSKPVFDYLNSLTSVKRAYKGKVLLATVEGDIHDIGKKIVATVLRSGGYEVIDIGKDVPTEEIISAIKSHKPDIVGLSAMMTTTVGKVEEVSSVIKKQGIKAIVIAGGASMSRTLSEKFGCDGYARNASEALELCNKISNRLAIETR